jgi:hypothetical protein
MGYGNYSQEAHQALPRGRADLPTQQVFQQTSCHPLMNPKGLKVRESRDSAEHPNSLGIVFALDVTGSMGEIPEQLARQELPNFMKLVTDCRISDPQVMFMAVGDATSDRAPLQVGQFETTAELMDQWLTFCLLEGGGGGQNHESYELALYLLAEHSNLDCWTKRKKRAYLFMTGDELPYPYVSRHQVEALIGDRLDEDVPLDAVVAAVLETYHPFFLIPDHQRRRRCEDPWRKVLRDHVICMESPRDTCAVAAGLLALTEGVVTDLDQLGKLLGAAGLERARVGAVLRALTAYAETLGRSGAPGPQAGQQADPSALGWLARLFSK